MNPEQTPSPNQQPTPPVFRAPYEPPFAQPSVSPGEATPEPELEDNKKNNKLLTITAWTLVAIELIVIIGLLIALAASPKSAVAPANDTANGNRSLPPTAATSLGVQQTDDSISQDLSGLVDQNDFPNGIFDDKSLGL